MVFLNRFHRVLCFLNRVSSFLGSGSGMQTNGSQISAGTPRFLP